MGQLSLNLTDASEPPLTQREGYIKRFAEAISGLFRDKGVDFEPDWIEQVVRHWDHKDEFHKEVGPTKSPAGVGGSGCYQNSSPFLNSLHSQEMENLEADLDFGDIWRELGYGSLLQRGQKSHIPRRLLNKMCGGWFRKTVQDTAPPSLEGMKRTKRIQDFRVILTLSKRGTLAKWISTQMTPGAPRHTCDSQQTLGYSMKTFEEGWMTSHCWKTRT